MKCLNSLLSEYRAATEAVAGARGGKRDTIKVGMGVPLPLVGTVPASSFLLTGEGFEWRLRQARGLAIALEK